MWFHASTQNSWKVVTSCILFLKSNSRKQCFHISRQGISTGRSKWWGQGSTEQPVEKVCKAARLAQGGPDRLGWALPRWEAGGSGQSSSFVHRLKPMVLKVCLYSSAFYLPTFLGSRVCACMSLNNIPLILLTFFILEIMYWLPTNPESLCPSLPTVTLNFA